MQTSAAIAAAAIAQERTPVATLKVDWDANGNYSNAVDDLSARVESLTIDRQLATDLPDEAARSAGYSSAQLTAVLSGDPATETTNAGSYFSPFNVASALFGKRRRWRNCQAQIGFGSNLLSVFTGKTSGLTVDSASRTATLDALDLAETMRGVVDLPLVIATIPNTAIHPGMNSSWVVDYIARKCGYYASPPQRTDCRLLVTFAGSGFPAVGTMTRVESIAGGLVAPIVFGSGKFIQGSSGTSTNAFDYSLSGTLSTNDGGELLIEGWANAPTGAQGICEILGGGANYNFVSMVLNASHQLVVNVRRSVGGAIASYNSGITVPTGQWAYLAAHVNFTSTTTTVQWRVNSTSASTSPATASVVGQQALTLASWSSATDSTGTGLACWNSQFEAWQVSNPGVGAGTPTWNDAYAGNSIIQPSLNNLTVTVPSQVSAWEQVQQIAAAELATAGFDESGTFTFYSRNRWTSAPYTTSQRTINATDSLTAIATSEAIDQVRNHVRVTATIATVNAAGWVWSAASVISVPASGSTTVTVDLGQPVYNLSTSIRYASTSGTTGQSQYRANRSFDGTGTAVSNLTFTVTVTAAQIATIVITNPNAFIVYLVTSSGFTDPQGTPSLALWGQPVDLTLAQQPDTTSTASTATSKQIIDVSDATSIAQHGDQLLELSGNPWLQDVSSLTGLANDLMARLKDPVPILDGLTIIGDPRLQLGDRVTIIEPNLGLNGDFFLTRIASTFDASGYTQALTVRAITTLIAGDTFDAANATDISGRATTTGNKTWIKKTGFTTAIGITNDKAAVTTSGSGGRYVVDTGVADMDASVDITFQTDCSLLIRADTSTAVQPILLCQLTTSGRRIAKIDGAGTYTAVASDAVAAVNGIIYTVRGVAHGNSITMYVNGVVILTYTLAGAETTTYVGHGAGFSGDATGAAWDNFSVSLG